jgi:hypothetical protein
VGAEGCGLVDGAAACVAVSGGGCRRHGASARKRAAGSGEDLAGDVDGLSGVILANATGHEEALDEAEEGGNSGPEEDEVEDAEAVASQVEVMDAEGAEDKSKEDADELVFAGAFIFGIKPGALLVVHVDGVDGIDGVHMSFLSNEYMGVYADWRTTVPFVIRLLESVFKIGFRLDGRNLQGFSCGVEF